QVPNGHGVGISGKRRKCRKRVMSKEENGETSGRGYPLDRRKRINRLKKMIILTLICAILIPIILCVILIIRVNRLEEKILMLEAARAQQEVTEREHEELLSVAQTDVDTIVRESALQTSGNSDPIQQTAIYGDEESVNNEQKDGQGESTFDAGSASENTVSDEDDGIRRVYLTFDDGPSSQTEAILAILDEYDIKATFFVVGKTDAHSVEMYQRIVEEGHTLAMHSYSHEYQDIYASPEAFREDLYRLRDYLYEITGVQCSIYRFPGGSSNKVSPTDIQELIAILEEEGITYFDWNVSSQDASPRTLSVEEIVENSTLHVEDYQNVVILMHDATNKTTTVEALPILIEELLGMEDTALLPITADTVPIQHRKPE
ncbi:MAG: polysaccharide deacetylase family protein, partial [Lachnospiraceae bacterium]